MLQHVQPALSTEARSDLSEEANGGGRRCVTWPGLVRRCRTNRDKDVAALGEPNPYGKSQSDSSGHGFHI